MNAHHDLPLVCVSGWGFGRGLWTPLLTQLAAVAGVRRVYWIDLWREETFTLPPQFVGVGHSLGALWLLRQDAGPMQAFISIAGFCRFPVAARVLARMQAQFAIRPDVVLKTFHARCFGDTVAGDGTEGRQEPEMNEFSPACLDQGLGWLAAWEAAPPACPMLALHGGRDVIVPPDAAIRDWPGCVVCPDGHHALPLTHPVWCAEQMGAFLAA